MENIHGQPLKTCRHCFSTGSGNCCRFGNGKIRQQRSRSVRTERITARNAANSSGGLAACGGSSYASLELLIVIAFQATCFVEYQTPLLLANASLGDEELDTSIYCCFEESFPI